MRVSYSPPSTGDVIQDRSANAAAAFSNRAVVNNSALPTVSIRSLHRQASSFVASPVFRFSASQVPAADIPLEMSLAQTDVYVPSDTSLTLGRGQQTVDHTLDMTYSGNVSGDLTLTLLPSDDYVVGATPNNAASVDVLAPVSGNPLTIRYPTGHVRVNEGSAVDYPMSFRLARAWPLPGRQSVSR